MSNGVFNLDSDPENSIFSPLKRQYGNPFINLLMGIATGNNYMPQPEDGQSMYDALIQRERSRQFAELQSSSFGNNALFQNLGINHSPMMSMMGMMAASPDSMTGKLLNNVLGGNPMAASMQLYAGLSGANTMGAFGRISGVTAGETEGIMQSLANNFYKRQEYEGEGGIREQIRNDTTKFLTKEAERGPEGIKYLEDLGIKGLELGNDGKLTEKSKQKIKNADLTAGEKADVSSIKDIISQKLGEQDEDIQKTLDKRLEEQLLARKVATKKEIDSSRDKNGLLDTSKINKLVADYENKPLTLSENLRDRIATKEFQANELSTAMEGLEAAKKKNDPNKIKEYNQKIQKILESNKLVPLGKEMTNYQDKEGGFDTEKLDSLVKGLRTRSEDERLYKKSEFFNEKGFKYKNYNFEKSRGFKLEDFTSGFSRAADLRALGDSKELSPEEAMAKFSENAGGAMSAARSVFGNKSGGELVANMSELVGSSSMDLGSEQGAGKMEDLLRRVKATQRVAGISIQTMLAVIKSGQELAANNPNLQFANSSANTELAMKAVRTAADSGRLMSSADFREAGGTQAMAMGEIQESHAFAQSGLGDTYATFLALAKGRTFVDDEGKEQDAFEAIKKLGSSGKITGSGLASGGMQEVAKILGMSTQEVAFQASNPLLAQEAKKDEDTLNAIYGAKQSSVMETLFTGMENKGVNRDELLAKYQEYKKEGKSDNEFFTQQLIPKLTTAESQDMFRSQKGTIAKGFRDSMRSPEEKNRMEELIKRQAEEDKEVSKKLDSKRSPIVTQTVEAMASGSEISQDAVMEGLSNVFTTKDVTKAETKKAVEKALDSAADLNSLVGDKNKTDEQKYKEGAADKVNDILKARVEKAKEQGVKTDVVATATQEKLELVRENLSGGMKNLSFKDSQKKLAELKKIPASKLNDIQKKELATLEAAKELGLSSERSFDMAKGGTLAAVSGAVVQGYADEEVKGIIEERKTIAVKQMGQRLEQQSKADTINDAEKQEQEKLKEVMQHYKKTDASGKEYIDWKELYEDKTNPTRKKAAGEKENYFAQEDKKSKQIDQDYDNLIKANNLQESYAKERDERRSRMKAGEQISPEETKKFNEKYKEMYDQSRVAIKILKQHGVTEEEVDELYKGMSARPDADPYDAVKFKEKAEKIKSTRAKNGSVLSREINETKDKLQLEQRSLEGQGKAAGENAVQKELGEAFTSLKNMIENGGGIKTALEGLATVLSK